MTVPVVDDAPMHADELTIDEPLVQGLLEQQFPVWAKLPLRRVEPAGTVHAIFRLGERMAVRLPRRDGPLQPASVTLDWLPVLAPLLPMAVPLPIAQGQPAEHFPWYWEIHTWLDGEVLPVEQIDGVEAAHDLAAFVNALQRVPTDNAPAGRGIPLADRETEFRFWLARLGEDRKIAAAWQRALDTPAWSGPPTWHHGDLDARNWLVRDGRIGAVIDWSAAGVGDPACDVMVAWKLGSAAARDAFRDALPIDDATWARARGWAISQAVAVLAYYTPANNPVLYSQAQSWLDLALSGRATN